MKKFISMFLVSAIVMSMGACSSGPSQGEYDKLASENAELRAQIEKLQDSEKTSPQSEKVDYEEDFEDQQAPAKSEVVYDENGIKITYTGISESFMGPQIDFIIENNSQKAATIQARNVSVNGVMTEPTFSSDVMPGKKAKDGIEFMEDEIEGGEIKELEFNFIIVDMDNFETVAESELISISI